MLISAVYLWQVVLAIHVVFVVAAFGLLLVHPFIVLAAERHDRRAVPAVLRARRLLGRSLVNPGLFMVVIAGVYLAAYEHQWSRFYVQWGIAAALVIGGLEGAVVIRQLGRLADLAERDIAASAPGAEVTWSGEYLTARGRAEQVSALLGVIVVVTVFLMVVK
ncbi:MAG TPA: hypothetical protein VFN65_01590 [Solirubrobacteraceae bacterium]|nr:hypothetical protein [Solirubrobacteraceae bacterium]